MGRWHTRRGAQEVKSGPSVSTKPPCVVHGTPSLVATAVNHESRRLLHTIESSVIALRETGRKNIFWTETRTPGRVTTHEAWKVLGSGPYEVGTGCQLIVAAVSAGL